MGATPKWFLATLLLPERKTNAKLATQIFRDIITSTQKLNITLCGGHTEISYKIDRPIVIGHMGEVEKDKLVVNAHAGNQAMTFYSQRHCHRRNCHYPYGEKAVTIKRNLATDFSKGHSHS